jgi:hypothetical protein
MQVEIFNYLLNFIIYLILLHKSINNKYNSLIMEISPILMDNTIIYLFTYLHLLLIKLTLLYKIRLILMPPL